MLIYSIISISQSKFLVINKEEKIYMTTIKMLGTGNGGTINLYNTCFAIQNKDGVFLVDTGGSIEIIKRLKQANIKLDEIKNIFISHSHTDHIL